MTEGPRCCFSSCCSFPDKNWHIWGALYYFLKSENQEESPNILGANSWSWSFSARGEIVMNGKFSARIDHWDDQIEIGSCVFLLNGLLETKQLFLLKSYLRSAHTNGSDSQNSLRSSRGFITFIQYWIHLQSLTSYPLLNQLLGKQVWGLGKLLSPYLIHAPAGKRFRPFFFMQAQTKSIKRYYCWGKRFLLNTELN